MAIGWACSTGFTTLSPLDDTQACQLFYDSVSGTWFGAFRYSDSDDWLWEWSGTEAANSWTRLTAVELQTQTSGRFTLFWDDANRTLHMLKLHTTANNYQQWTYNGTTWTNTVNEAFPVNPGYTASIVVAHDGTPWVSVQTGGSWQTYYRSGGTWTAGPTVGSYSLSGDALGQLVRYKEGVNNAVGFVYANDAAGQIRFSYRLDTDLKSASWADELAYTGLSTDNHLSAIGNGTDVVCTFKDPGDDCHVGYRSAGTWQTKATARIDGTRPKLLFDATNGIGYSIYGDSVGINSITRIKSNDVTLSTMTAGTEVTQFESDTPVSGDFEVAGTPTHAVTSDMSPVPIFGTPQFDHAWFNTITVAAGGDLEATGTTATATAQGGSGTAALGTELEATGTGAFATAEGGSGTAALGTELEASGTGAFATAEAGSGTALVEGQGVRGVDFEARALKPSSTAKLRTGASAATLRRGTMKAKES